MNQTESEINSSIKKSKGKKPFVDPWEGIWKCPRCGKAKRLIAPYPFCPHCGQRIDWSEED